MVTLPEIFQMISGEKPDPKFKRADLDKPIFVPDDEKDSESNLQNKNELSGLHDILGLFSDVIKDKTQMV